MSEPENSIIDEQTETNRTRRGPSRHDDRSDQRSDDINLRASNNGASLPPARDLSDGSSGMNSYADRNTQAGFSLIELLVVCSIIVIVSCVTIFQLIGNRRAFRTDDQALQILSFMRQASQRSLTQRQPQRLEINLTSNVIRLIDENTASATDDVEVNRLTLENSSDVKLSTTPTMLPGGMTGTSKPANVTLPTAPAQPNFPAVLFVADANNNSVWSVRYMSDGRVVDGSGNIVSATLFLWVPLPNNADSADLQKVRAISFFGSTGATKLWSYTGTGTAFVAK